MITRYHTSDYLPPFSAARAKLIAGDSYEHYSVNKLNL